MNSFYETAWVSMALVGCLRDIKILYNEELVLILLSSLNRVNSKGVTINCHNYQYFISLQWHHAKSKYWNGRHGLPF
jgi:hypothetical protein